MLKCRMNLGVTGLRPPPGGAHAAQMITSCVCCTYACVHSGESSVKIKVTAIRIVVRICNIYTTVGRSIANIYCRGCIWRL